MVADYLMLCHICGAVLGIGILSNKSAVANVLLICICETYFVSLWTNMSARVHKAHLRAEVSARGRVLEDIVIVSRPNGDKRGEPSGDLSTSLVSTTPSVRVVRSIIATEC